MFRLIEFSYKLYNVDSLFVVHLLPICVHNRVTDRKETGQLNFLKITVVSIVSIVCELGIIPK